MDLDKPSRADLYALNTASYVAGRNLSPLKFHRNQPAQTIPVSEQRYASTTDDPSGWWVPEPLTIDQLSKIGLATRVQHG